MTQNEFRTELEQKSDLEMLGVCLRDELVPYVFQPKPAAWPEFRQLFTAELNVGAADVIVIGSGRLGFSLKPGRALKDFSETSDIDVSVINETVFDSLWMSLLNAAYPRDSNVLKLGGWLETRRNEVYTGWLTPLEIRLDRKIFGPKAEPVLDFNSRWFNLLKRGSVLAPRRHERINGRLYRTWSHAEQYHLHSLSALRRTLSQKKP